MESEIRIRRQMIEIGKRIYQSGMVAANDGNLSAHRYSFQVRHFCYFFNNFLTKCVGAVRITDIYIDVLHMLHCIAQV